MLGPGEIHIWTATPAVLDDPAVAARCAALLTEEEHARNARFRHERNRREDLLSRAMIRSVLSRYRPVEPTAWRFRKNDHGRPELDPPCGLHFNLTHHPTLVACAVAEELEVGVDVEPLSRGASLCALAPRVFAPTELAALGALPAEAQPERAVALWTLKEAYIKARGLGLSLPLAGFAFGLDDPAAPTISFVPHAIEDDSARWWFWTMDVDGHRIALAAERTRGIPHVHVHGWGLET
jgi:4'-phosphopantetheinyl transferase